MFHERLAGRATIAVKNPVRLDDFSGPEPVVALLRDVIAPGAFPDVDVDVASVLP